MSIPIVSVSRVCAGSSSETGSVPTEVKSGMANPALVAARYFVYILNTTPSLEMKVTSASASQTTKSSSVDQRHVDDGT